MYAIAGLAQLSVEVQLSCWLYLILTQYNVLSSKRGFFLLQTIFLAYLFRSKLKAIVVSRQKAICQNANIPF